MDIWKGAFSGIYKHRDYEHATFFEHVRDNGGILGFKTDEGDYVDIYDYDVGELDDLEEELLEEMRKEVERMLEYWLTVNPVTGLKLAEPELYYALVIAMSGEEYDYFIPAPGGRLLPSPRLIEDTLDAYMENNVDGRYDLILDNTVQG